jgi:3-hydroxyacyl-CoA dehydrogenase
MLEIETIAILGADRDAVRLALLSALAGLDVRVGDPSADALDAAFRELRGDVERALTDGRLDREQRQRIFDGVLFTPELDEAVVGADLVFAAGPRDVAPARELLATLTASCRATTLLATRLDPAEIAGGLAQPGRVVGLGLEEDDGLFPRLSLLAGAATTAHARERGGQLVARLARAAGYSSR